MKKTFSILFACIIICIFFINFEFIETFASYIDDTPVTEVTGITEVNWTVTRSGSNVTYSNCADTISKTDVTGYDFTVTADTGYTLPMPYYNDTGITGVATNYAIGFDFEITSNSYNIDYSSLIFNNTTEVNTTLQIISRYQNNPVQPFTSDINITINAIPITTDIAGVDIITALENNDGYYYIEFSQPITNIEVKDNNDIDIGYEVVDTKTEINEIIIENQYIKIAKSNFTDNTAVISGEIIKYGVSITIDDENISPVNFISGDFVTVEYGGNYSVIIEPNLGYTLPTNLTLDNATYLLNDDGTATISVTDVTKATRITIPSDTANIITYDVNFDLDNIILPNDYIATVDYGTDDYSVTVQPELGYLLPNSISIKMGDSDLGQEQYSYNSITGEIIITISIIGNIEVSVLAEKIHTTFTTIDPNISSNITDGEIVSVNEDYVATLSIDYTNYNNIENSLEFIEDVEQFISITVNDISIDNFVNSINFVIDNETITITIPKEHITGDIKISVTDIITQIKTYNISVVNFDNIEPFTDITVDYATQNIQFTITAIIPFLLPDEIQIVMGENILTHNDYIYSIDGQVGTITIITHIIGDIEVSGTPSVIYLVDLVLVDTDNNIVDLGATLNDIIISTDGTYNITISADEGFILPTEIAISIGEFVTQNFNYNIDTTQLLDIATIEIIPTDNIKITIVATSPQLPKYNISFDLEHISIEDNLTNDVITAVEQENFTITLIADKNYSLPDKIELSNVYDEQAIDYTYDKNTGVVTFDLKQDTIIKATGLLNYYIYTEDTEIEIEVTSLIGGTIIIEGENLENVIIVPTTTTNIVTTDTKITIPDHNGNIAVWTIPAGSEIDYSNHLNLGLVVSDIPVHSTSNEYGTSIGYIDFVHVGELLSNNLQNKSLELIVYFKNASYGDAITIHKLNNTNEDLTTTYVEANVISDYYVQANFYTCSKWEVFSLSNDLNVDKDDTNVEDEDTNNDTNNETNNETNNDTNDYTNNDANNDTNVDTDNNDTNNDANNDTNNDDTNNYYNNYNSNYNTNYNLEYYNIPTSANIAGLKNIILNQFINLDAIFVEGETIIGWYYDKELTIPVTVTDFPYIVITEEIIKNGLFPKYDSTNIVETEITDIIATDITDTITTDITDITKITDITTTEITTSIPKTCAILMARLF